MKYILCLIIAFIPFYSLCQNSSINLQIENVKEIRGNIQIGLYKSANNFPKVAQEFKTYFLDVTEYLIHFKIEGLHSGEYALAIFHDLNSDGKIEKNILGIPKEPYGFSNNVVPVLSAPSFKRAKFNLDSTKAISIRLR